MINVAFLPSSRAFLGNRFFGVRDRDDVLEPFRVLRELLSDNAINLDTYDLYPPEKRIDVIIVSRYESNIKNIFRILSGNSEVRVIMLMTEELNIAPLHTKSILDSDMFSIVMTWRDDYIDNKKYHKYFYPSPARALTGVRDYDEKKFMVMINSFKRHHKGTTGDLYVERLLALEYFAGHSEIDLYGVGWGRLRNKLIRSVYKGEVEEKGPTLRDYKFSLVFENSNNDIGGITEKMFDVMAAGCVPVYWGAPNVEEYVPRGCYIDYRRFGDYKELNRLLKGMRRDEYDGYIGDIRRFLDSDSYRRFTSEYFAKRMLEMVNKVLHMPARTDSPRELKRDLIRRVFANYAYLRRYRRLMFELVTA